MKSHKSPEKQYDLERLIFFSDGVFAIAITLLVIEFRLPEHWDGSWAMLIDGLGPKIICYAISFCALTAFWTAHRFIFRYVEKFSEPASLLNLLFLLTMSLVPFANAMLVEHSAQMVAIELYVGLVIAASTCMAAMWGYLALLVPSINAEIGTVYRWIVFVRLLVMPPIFSVGSIWLGERFGPWVAVSCTLVIAIAAGRFRVLPMPARPEVKEI